MPVMCHALVTDSTPWNHHHIDQQAVKDAARLYSWYRFGGEAEDAGGLREGGEDGLVAAEGMLEDDGTGGDIGNEEDEEDEDNAPPPPGAGAVADVAVQMPPPPQPPLQPPPQYQQQQHPAAGAPALHAQAQAIFAQMDAEIQQNQMQLPPPQAPPAPQPMAVVGAPEQQQQHAGDETGSSDNEG